MKKLLIFLILVAMALPLCACGTDASRTPQSPEPSSVPVEADVPSAPAEPEEQKISGLNYGLYRMSEHLNPWRYGGSDPWLHAQVYESLLYSPEGDPDDIRGCLAESWEHSEDGLTWTFRIREGVTFTDGTICSAEAIAASWEYALTCDQAVMEFSWHNVLSWKAEGDLLTVTLSAPSALLETWLCGTDAAVLSPEAIALWGLDDPRGVVGTGPYLVEEFNVEESRAALAANENYYLPERAPGVMRVNLQYYSQKTWDGSFSPLLDALLAGEIDGAVFSWDASNYLRLKEGYSGTVTAIAGGSSPIWLNPGHSEYLQTFEVRQAMCRLIDLQSMNDELYMGLGTVQNSIWAAGSPCYVPDSSFYYDPNEGFELLASVGVSPHMVQLSQQISTDDRMLEKIYSQLRDSHFDIELSYYTDEWSTTPIMSGEWNFTVTGFSYCNFRPDAPWGFCLPQGALIKCCCQDIYDPRLYSVMLEKYEQLNSAARWEELAGLGRELTELVQDDFGALPGVQPPFIAALSEDFTGAVYVSGPDGTPYLQYNSLRLAKKPLSKAFPTSEKYG